MLKAASEKERLEVKQRTVRKEREQRNEVHNPAYFKEVLNPEDGQMYWKYNYQYFEEDRLKQDWSRLPDLFSE